jgi:[acyl-carrier-protein] S-malonyltransferase
VLGYDLWKRCQEGPEEALNQTECTQPAMLAAGVATYRLWRERGGPAPALMAGHSLGEFSALVAAGCLDFKEAVDREVSGEAMQAAVPPGEGAMAAILGLEDIDVAGGMRRSGQGDVVEAVNFNAPGQVVIAGNAPAVSRAIEAATAKGAKRRAMALPVSVPAHSSLMAPAAEKLRERLAKASSVRRRPRGSTSTAST